MPETVTSRQWCIYCHDTFTADPDPLSRAPGGGPLWVGGQCPSVLDRGPHEALSLAAGERVRTGWRAHTRHCPRANPSPTLPDTVLCECIGERMGRHSRRESYYARLTYCLLVLVGLIAYLFGYDGDSPWWAWSLMAFFAAFLFGGIDDAITKIRGVR